MKRQFVVGVIYVLLSVVCYGQKKPNIVIVVADDLGVPLLGCYGSSFYKTPNLDRLAQRGAMFTNAYAAAAVCSPTRAAIMTGKHPARLHLTDFISGNKSTNYPLVQPNWQKYLPTEEITIAEIFKQNGYETAFFGKWNLSKARTPPASLSHNPNHQGFNETFATYKPSKKFPLGKWQTAEEDAHSVDTLTNRAIDFVQRNKDAQFMLVLSHNSIHSPIIEKEASIRKFEHQPDASEDGNNPTVAAMVQRLDNAFGRLYSSITDLDLLENTVIIFCSDNGASGSYTKQTPYRKGKGWLYEGGIRVPLLIQWNDIKENTIIDSPVVSMDLFPTVLALASIVQPNPLVDGVNLAPILVDNQPLPSRDLYWHYPHYHKGSGMLPASVVRSGDYKLIQWHEPKMLQQSGVYELYNLREDVSESTNLATKLPEKTKELEQYLEKWKSKIGAQQPLINVNYKQ